MPFKKAIEQRANKGKTSIYLTAHKSRDKAARKSRNSALNNGNTQPLNPERTPRNRLLSMHWQSRDEAMKNDTEARTKREEMNL